MASAVGIRSTPSCDAPARGRIYGLLSALLASPATTQPAAPQKSLSPADINALLAELPYQLRCPSELLDEQASTGLQSEYFRLFELHITGPPCVLYGGAWSADRQATMQELLRYFRHFGLTVNGAAESDLPDSIVTVLEFMQFLCISESMAQSAADAASVRLAQRDILSRHLAMWVPKMLERIRQLAPRQLYAGVMTLMNEFIVADLAYLQHRLAG